MSYYDHATEMHFKLGRWAEATPVRNYELEALELQQLSAASMLEDALIPEKPLIVGRLMCLFRYINVSKTN